MNVTYRFLLVHQVRHLTKQAVAVIPLNQLQPQDLVWPPSFYRVEAGVHGTIAGQEIAEYEASQARASLLPRQSTALPLRPVFGAHTAAWWGFYTQRETEATTYCDSLDPSAQCCTQRMAHKSTFQMWKLRLREGEGLCVLPATFSHHHSPRGCLHLGCTTSFCELP